METTTDLTPEPKPRARIRRRNCNVCGKLVAIHRWDAHVEGVRHQRNVEIVARAGRQPAQPANDICPTLDGDDMEALVGILFPSGQVPTSKLELLVDWLALTRKLVG